MASCTATVASLSLQCVTVDTGDHHKVNAGVITALCYSNEGACVAQNCSIW